MLRASHRRSSVIGVNHSCFKLYEILMLLLLTDNLTASMGNNASRSAQKGWLTICSKTHCTRFTSDIPLDVQVNESRYHHCCRCTWMECRLWITVMSSGI